MAHIEIVDFLCDGCGNCVDSCPLTGIYMEGGIAHIREGYCDACGLCISECNKNAIIFVEDDE
jgi:ferredoxin